MQSGSRYSNDNCTREELMHRIAMYSFAVVDANLYLDAYPDSKPALEYFHKYSKELDETTALYTEKFGPLTAGASSRDRFDWIDEPWPWQ